MSSPNLNIRSTSRKRSLASQQHSDMHLEIGFCGHNCVKLTASIPSIIGKSTLEREHPFFTKFVFIMNSCFIQYDALCEKHVNITQ